jgi:hypothetical protein
MAIVLNNEIYMSPEDGCGLASIPAEAGNGAVAGAATIATPAPGSSTLSRRNALSIPSSLVRSRTTMPRTKSPTARLASLALHSCHPANSPATTCCV